MSQTRDIARLKTNIKARWEKFIYGPFDDYYRRTLEEIIAENDVLVYGPDIRGWIFTYQGKRYTQVNFRRPPQNIPRLFNSLHGRMDELLAEQRKIEQEEKPFVMGYLTKLLNSSDQLETILSRVPTSLRPPLEDVYAQIPETMEGVGTDEAAEAVGAHQKSLDALKVRLMTNLILGDR